MGPATGMGARAGWAHGGLVHSGPIDCVEDLDAS